MLTDKQKDYIKQNYLDMTYPEIASEIDCKKTNVQKFISSNLPNKNEVIRERRIKLVQKHYDDWSMQRFAKEMDISVVTCRDIILTMRKDGVIDDPVRGYNSDPVKYEAKIDEELEEKDRQELKRRLQENKKTINKYENKIKQKGKFRNLKIIKEFDRFYLAVNEHGHKTCIQKPVSTHYI